MTELLSQSYSIKDQIFNVGYQNMSINQIAEIVKNTVESEFPEIENIMSSVLFTDNHEL